MFDLVGIGTNSVDDVLVLASGLQSALATGKAPILQRHTFCGGQTATTLAACARFGLRTRYLGVFGSDERAHMMREALEDHGVDITQAQTRDAANRFAVIIVGPGGTRTVLWHRTEHLRFDLDAISPDVLSARIVHVDDEDGELALRAARMAARAKMPITSDIEHLTERTEELVGAVTYPIFDHELPGKLTGEEDPERALRKLRRLNPHPLVMTLGDRGAIALEGDRIHHASACDVKVVDSTGAGDVFRAGFIYGLLQRWAIPQTLRFANAAAALACTKLGAIPSVPSLDDVHSRSSTAR